MRILRPRLPRVPNLERKVIYCDIGARDGIGNPWARIRPSIRCIRFEPDPEEHARLSRQLPEGDVCLPLALYSRSAEIALHLTKSRGCSSIYRPNTAFLERYPESARFEVEKTVLVQATSLDELYDAGTIADIDFIKVDVQGAELDILQGGRRLIADKVLGIEAEVEFSPMYTGQPLFRDVDRHLAAEGFQLHDLRRNYWKLKGGERNGALKGQVIFGDALYLRPPEDVLRILESASEIDARGKVDACLVMAISYGYLDYAHVLLSYPAARKILGVRKAAEWDTVLAGFGKSLRFWRDGPGHLGFVFHSLYRLFQSSHGGWATSDGPLGSTKWFGWFQ